MSIVVAVRVRPHELPGSFLVSTPTRSANSDALDDDEDPSVCGTIRFVNSRNVTFTQKAMEMLESDRVARAVESKNSTPRTALTGRRSTTPTGSQRASSLRSGHAHSPSTGRPSTGSTANTGRSWADGITPHFASNAIPRKRFSRPIFEFDSCFASDSNNICFATQSDVYAELGAPMLAQLLSGFNCCLMAYGQTGSGKTYSMLGPYGDELMALQRLRSSKPPRPEEILAARNAASSPLVHRLLHDDNRGLMLRMCERLFLEVEHQEVTARKASLAAATSKQSSSVRAGRDNPMVKYELVATYYQIYRERVYCLLRNEGIDEGKWLRVRESGTEGPYVEGLAAVKLQSLADVVKVLERGTKHRRVASTHQNMHSSRSHAVFSIRVRCVKGTSDSSFTSVLNLVDLAGSERSGKHGGTTARIAEASDINTSLSCLGKVIHVLATQRGATRSPSPQANSPLASTRSNRGGPKGSQNPPSPTQPTHEAHVPYRDSTLTFLLRDSIGGNSRTTILSTISPCFEDIAETMSTLRYASKARLIVNTPVVNTDTKSVLLVKSLREEVLQLRLQLKESVNAQNHNGHVDALSLELQGKEQLIEHYEYQMNHVEELRNQWEEEKVSMIEKLGLLESEAAELRGELNAARETAQEYRDRLERLTAAVEKKSRENSPEVIQEHATALLMAREATSGQVSMPTTLTVKEPHDVSAAPAAVASRAIVFGSRSSNAQIEVPSTEAKPAPTSASLQPPLVLVPAETSPSRHFTSGSKPVAAADVGKWTLPERYQWMLQPSRSTSQDSSERSPPDKSVPISLDASAAERRLQPPLSQPPPLASRGASQPFVKPPLSPREISSAAVTGSSATLGRVGPDSRAQPLDGGSEDEFDDFAVDGASFVKAAAGAGIDIMAMIKAKKREKKEQKKRLESSSAQRQRLAMPQTSILPPPDFQRSGNAPPPLIPTLKLPAQTNGQSRKGVVVGGGDPHHNNPGTAPSSVNSAVDKFRQRLLEQQPPPAVFKSASLISPTASRSRHTDPFKRAEEIFESTLAGL